VTRPAASPRRGAARRGYHHGDLHRALLDAARSVLREEGPEGCSLREVARRAGVSHAAPYHHFASRQEILGALAAEGYLELDRTMVEAQAAAPADPEAQLVAVGMGYFLLAQRQPALFRLMIRPEHLGPPPAPHSVAEPDDEGCRGPSARLRAALARLLGRTATEGETHLCWAAVHGLALLALDGGLGVSPAALTSHARDVVSRLAGGLRCAAGADRPADRLEPGAGRPRAEAMPGPGAPD
jgi:AcrR family transcriptional regulator